MVHWITVSLLDFQQNSKADEVDKTSQQKIEVLEKEVSFVFCLLIIIVIV